MDLIFLVNLFIDCPACGKSAAENSPRPSVGKIQRTAVTYRHGANDCSRHEILRRLNVIGVAGQAGHRQHELSGGRGPNLHGGNSRHKTALIREAAFQSVRIVSGDGEVISDAACQT